MNDIQNATKHKPPLGIKGKGTLGRLDSQEICLPRSSPSGNSVGSFQVMYLFQPCAFSDTLPVVF